MRRIAALALVVAVAATVAAASALGRPAKAPTLVGTVGPGFTITLKQGGKVVKTLKAGTYTFMVHDKASIHAFSLDGPHGFAKDFTTIPFVGAKSVTVKLKAGSYKYYCPNHESVMFGHFKAS